MLLPAMMELCEIIRGEMEACGVISFARFMELSLYCPEFGYYERLVHTPGKGGDFYTSPGVGSLFGELLAFQFARWMEESGFEQFQLLEAGAHDGRLAEDILNWFKSRRPDLLDILEYRILEPSPRRRQWQEKGLRPFAGKVNWFEAWNEPPAAGVQGVIFSNELLDALPVHRLGWDAKARTWFEWGVAMEEGNFVWRRLSGAVVPRIRIPHSKIFAPPSAFRAPQDETLLSVLPDGFTTEVSPAAEAWWRQAASSLGRGRLLTFDFGMNAEEFFLPHRANGTLRAYHGHRLGTDLLANAGEQDLTAHVNFSGLKEAGESAGLRTEGLFSQEEFLKRAAEAGWCDPSVFGEWTTARTRQFQTLTHPEHFGRAFQVLVQSR